MYELYSSFVPMQIPVSRNTILLKMVGLNLETMQERMTQRPLRVLIVSGVGAHQKAIQTLCASAPQIKVIDTAFSSLQAFSMARDNLPDLLILGANLTKNRVCETLSQIRTLPNPPYCIVLTVSEFGACFDQQVEADRVIPTASFAYRLPEILKQVSLR